MDKPTTGHSTVKHSQVQMDLMNKSADPRSTANDFSRSFSDIRARLAKPVDVVELASIPSEISEDEWAEITKYQ
jgi:hypothetical protein